MGWRDPCSQGPSARRQMCRLRAPFHPLPHPHLLVQQELKGHAGQLRQRLRLDIPVELLLEPLCTCWHVGRARWGRSRRGRGSFVKQGVAKGQQVCRHIGLCQSRGRSGIALLWHSADPPEATAPQCGDVQQSKTQTAQQAARQLGMWLVSKTNPACTHPP